MKIRLLFITLGMITFTYCSAQEYRQPGRTESESKSSREVIRTPEARLGGADKSINQERVIFDGPEKRSIRSRTKNIGENQSSQKVFVGPERQTIKGSKQ